MAMRGTGEAVKKIEKKWEGERGKVCGIRKYSCEREERRPTLGHEN